MTHAKWLNKEENASAEAAGEGAGVCTRSLCKNHLVPWALATVLVSPILGQLPRWALSSPKEFILTPSSPPHPEVLGAGPCTGAGSERLL